MASDVLAPSRSSRGAGHLPVMPAAVLRECAVQPGMVVLDCTAGGGGHLARFADAVGPTGRVVALDRDERAFADDAAGGVARARPHVTLLRRAFAEARAALDELGVEHVDVVFADLGVSSFQLDEGERGFSFRADAPLDMRMDTSQGPTAAELIASLSESDLADVIFRYGEERGSRRVARAIKLARPQTTQQLVDAVYRALGPQRGRIHPATKTFQGLRIAVNAELLQLQELLAALPSLLRTGGRAGLLTFHSLEDRLVKQAFRARREDGRFVPTTKKPLCADDEEQRDNPRSRSAKLRVAVWTAAADDDRDDRHRGDEDDDSDDRDDEVVDEDHEETR
jgi:16S rRNA (cytosine1402-N4)-methyltransferase